MELEETKIGRLDHKIAKLRVADPEGPGRRVPPDRERLGRRRPDADRLRPLRRHRRDHAGDAQPADPGGQRDQHARGGQHRRRQRPPVGGEDRRRGGPPLQQGDLAGDRHRRPDHDHRPADPGVGRGPLRPPRVRLLVVTGGPAVARAALASKRRAIVAGPGNPPVVVDATACLENAAKSIVEGRLVRQQPALHRREAGLRRRRHLRQADGRGRPPRRLPPELAADRRPDEGRVQAGRRRQACTSTRTSSAWTPPSSASTPASRSPRGRRSSSARRAPITRSSSTSR